MTAEIPIKIKHAGKIYDTAFSFNEIGKDFKSRVESLTGVPSDRWDCLFINQFICTNTFI